MEHSRYKILGDTTFQLDEYSLVPIRKEDMFSIMHWRNAQMDVLRQNQLLTPDTQEIYFEKNIRPSFNEDQPKIILFSYLKGNKCLGYGGMTNNDWPSKRSEMSFLLDNSLVGDDVIYTLLFTKYIQLLKKVVFNCLGFHRLFTETFDIRPLHVSILESQDFKFEGRMKDHVLIEGKYVDSLLHGCLNI